MSGTEYDNIEYLLMCILYVMPEHLETREKFMENKCYGSYGWKEFNQNRDNILNEFDRVKALIERRPVKTAHGVAVEAFIRDWLAEYLPKKYAVTSGYVIPDVFDFDYKLYHYDIIIYNKLESPILWVEGNLDDSESGKSRAIPAKYVVAIYEVKSTLDKKNATDSITKLKEINSFATHLPPNFCSGSIFIELKKENVSKQNILSELFQGNKVPGYWGGVILRCEIDPSMTGLFAFANGEGGDDGYFPDIDLAKPLDDLQIYLQEDGNLTLEETGGGAKVVCTAPHTWSVTKEFGPHYREGSLVLMLSWSHSKFAEFAIQVVCCLEGIPYDSEKRPRYGQVFDAIEKKQAEQQSDTPAKGLPHLSVTPSRFETSGSYIEAKIIEDFIETKIKYEIKNLGDVTAAISEDGFKTTTEIDSGEKKFRTIISKISQGPNNDNPLEAFIEMLENGKEKLQFTFSVLYRPQNNKNQFFKKVVTHEFAKDKVKLIEKA